MGVKINVLKLCVKMVAFLGVFGNLNDDSINVENRVPRVVTYGPL